MTELLQLLTAAKSLDDQAGLHDVINQHAAIINQQAQQIQVLQRQMDAISQSHLYAILPMALVLLGLVLYTLISIDRLQKRSMLQQP